MKRTKRGCAMLAGLVLMGLASLAKAGSGLEAVPCWFVAGDDWPEHACHLMRVPEDHSLPDGRQISFPVLHIRAWQPVSGRQPLLHTGGGGPGYAMGLDDSRSVEWMLNIYAELSFARGRDLVLIDPRGVGLAQPRLACPESVAVVWHYLDKEISNEALMGELVAASGECKLRLQKSGIDLRQYDSLAVAHDIERLRHAMKVSRWNVYGISYGTRYALTLAREYPASIRSLLLDSTVFPDLRYSDKEIRDGVQAFESMLRYCANNDACAIPYNKGEKLLRTLYRSLEENPLRFTITHPLSFEPQAILFDGDFLLDILFSNIYWDSFYLELGDLLKSLQHSNVDLVAPYVRKELVELAKGSMSSGLMSATFCREEYPFVDYDKALSDKARLGYLGQWAAWPVEFGQRECENWALAPSAPIEGQPIVTAIPTLLLHGEMDPVLPVADLDAQMLHFSRAAYLVFPQVAHDVIGSSACAELEAADFIDQPMLVLDEEVLGRQCPEAWAGAKQGLAQ